MDPAVPPASLPPYINISPPFPPPEPAVPALRVRFPALPESLLPASIVKGCPTLEEVDATGFIVGAESLAKLRLPFIFKAASKML